MKESWWLTVHLSNSVCGHLSITILVITQVSSGGCSQSFSGMPLMSCPVLPKDIHCDLSLPQHHPTPCCAWWKQTLGRHTKAHLIPSHCTMGGNGQTGIIPLCSIGMPCPYIWSISSHCSIRGIRVFYRKGSLCHHTHVLSAENCTMWYTI